MEKQFILDAKHLELTLKRLSHELIESHNDFLDTVFVGLQPYGIQIVAWLKENLEEKDIQNYFVNLMKRYTFDIYYQDMKTVSLKIDESIFVETEKILSNISIPRNRYINEALDYYNKIQKRQLLQQKLKKESELVKKDSMDILKDFEDLDYAD